MRPQDVWARVAQAAAQFRKRWCGMFVEGVFQSPTYFVGFGLLRQRDLFADCPTQLRILLMEVSVVRVSKASGHLMNRGRPVRLERLLQDLLQPDSFANPDCSRLPPPMASAGLPMSGSDPMAEFSVGLIEPIGVCVAQASRNLRQGARVGVIKSRQKGLPEFARTPVWRYGPLPVRAKASFAATMCAGVGPDGANRIEAGIFRNRQVRSRFSSRGTRAPSNQFWRML